MNPTERRKQIRSLLLGGLAPLIAFTVVEHQFGIGWGLLVAGLMGLAEIIFERVRSGRVRGATWLMNGAVLLLGWMSALEIPGLVEAALAALLVGSWAIGRSLLLEISPAPPQAPPEIQEILRGNLRGMTLRLGLLLGALGAVNFVWKPERSGWILGVSLVVYLVVETRFLRYRFAKWKSSQLTPPR